MSRRLSCLLVLFLMLAGSDLSRAGTQKWQMLVSAANPVHWYRFNEAAGTTEAFDHGSAGLDGIYRSLVELGQDGVFGPGEAAQFERGGQDDVMWTQGGNVTSPEWTAEFIVMKMSNAEGEALSDSAAYSLRLVGWGVDYEISFTEYGVIDARFTPVAGADLVAPLEQWVHVVYRKSGDQTQVFLDGALVGTTSTLIDCPIDSFGGRAASASDGLDGFLDEAVIYDYALTDAEIAAHAAAPFLPDVGAILVLPEDGAVDVPVDTMLAWIAGTYAQTHDVYLGTVFEDVNSASRDNPLDVLVSQDQTAADYDPPGPLDLGTTYYWRIDEVNGAPDFTIYKGDVWRFTTEPVAYPIPTVLASSNGISEPGAGPENTINGSGLDAADQHSTVSSDMWLAGPPEGEPFYIQYEFDRIYKLHEMLVWNYNVQFELLLGFGVKDVTVEHSENGADWTTLGDVQLNQATALATYAANTTVDFGGVPARYVRLTVNSGYGTMGQYGLSEVRFLYIPAQAREPDPADGATDVDPATALSWRAGRGAASHEVYLGTDPNALPLAATADQATYVPDSLEFGGTYYWQIVEVNEADETPAWAGDVWSFSTREYALIDGFETYDDEIEAGTAIFDTWLDGWVNGTGSIVGYFDAPFAERTIVRSGGQSMPLQYDNTDDPFYSEATREFETAQDWTGYGADALVLYVRGNPPAFFEQADGSILMGSTGGDIWGTADAFRFAYKRLTGDGSIQARVDSIVNTSAWAKGGVMIRESLDAGAAHAMTVVTPGNGVALQYRPRMNQASLNVNQADLTAPYWVRITRTGDTLTAERSADGAAWTSITADAAASSVTIPMAADVYIGLALVSNNAGASPTAAEFSNVSTSGNVTGQWQTEDIGGGQLTSNDPSPMYVRIEDVSGQAATVVHPDDAVTVRPTWQAWTIPFSDLAGVNLGRVETMTIGIGNATSPSAGGAGTVYIDDVGYGRPAAP